MLVTHLLATVARLMRPGDVRAVAAESLLLKHQLILNRPHKRAPHLATWDRHFWVRLAFRPPQTRSEACGHSQALDVTEIPPGSHEAQVSPALFIRMSAPAGPERTLPRRDQVRSLRSRFITISAASIARSTAIRLMSKVVILRQNGRTYVTSRGPPNARAFFRYQSQLDFVIRHAQAPTPAFNPGHIIVAINSKATERLPRRPQPMMFRFFMVHRRVARQADFE